MLEIFALHSNATLLLFFRALGLVAILPLGPHFSRKLALSFALALLFSGDVTPGDVPSIAPAVEFLIGVGLGLPLTLVCQGVSVFGGLIDAGRGQNLGQMLDPLLPGGSQALPVLLQGLTWARLLMMGALEVLVKGYAVSINHVPPGSYGLLAQSEFGQSAIRFISYMLSQSFSLFLPFAVSFLVADLAAAFTNKLIPSFGLNSELFQVKGLLALVLLVGFYGSGLEQSAMELIETHPLLPIIR